MKKILFVDLDDTLLNSQKEVTEGNRNAIKKMLAQGHYFVINTGRPVESARMVAKTLGFTDEGCYMVCYNGAVMYDCAKDEILEKTSLCMEDVSRLFEEAKKAGLHIQTYQDGKIVTCTDSRELAFYRNHTHLESVIVEDINEALTQPPMKALLIDLDNTGKMDRFLEEQESWTSMRMNAFFSCEWYLEYCPKGVDKGLGVEKMAKLLGVPMENTVAVGDERNDLTMIKRAHIGVAMANAHEELIAIADEVTTRNQNEDGVAEVIEKFILNG